MAVPRLRAVLEARPSPFANVAAGGERCRVASWSTTRPSDDHEEALTRAVTDLRYGGIGINVWPGLILRARHASWGAFPDTPREDIQSRAGRRPQRVSFFDLPREIGWVRARSAWLQRPPGSATTRTFASLGQRSLRSRPSPPGERFSASFARRSEVEPRLSCGPLRAHGRFDAGLTMFERFRGPHAPLPFPSCSRSPRLRPRLRSCRSAAAKMTIPPPGALELNGARGVRARGARSVRDPHPRRHGAEILRTLARGDVDAYAVQGHT